MSEDRCPDRSVAATVLHLPGASRASVWAHLVAATVVRPALKVAPLSMPTTWVLPVIDRVAALGSRSPAVRYRPVRDATWHGELVSPAGGARSPGVIVYFHGGAFMSCGLGTHRRLVERLAGTTGMSVLAVAYRQMPHGHLEDSVDDCESAVRWLLGAGYDAGGMVLAGDSAGGYLVFATALRMRERDLGTPAGLVGLSAWLDFDAASKVSHPNAVRDAYIPAGRLEQVARMVVGSLPRPDHSPVNADLSGLPPVLLICAAGEVLRVDSELMAERLAAAGVPCTLQIWDGQVHAFPALTALVPEARAAVDEVASFVAAVTSGDVSAG